MRMENLSSQKQPNYALITAARNEEDYIGKCIDSVIGQSVKPDFWVIVSDGSVDRTEEIVRDYARFNHWIHLVRREPTPSNVGFSSKVFALKKGLERLNDRRFDYIGHLDADITLPSHYYSIMTGEFEKNPRLGIAGGYILESPNGEFKSRKANSPWSVAGGIQFFRYECYRDIGDLIPMPQGGEDWYAEIVARMRNWEVKAFPTVPAFHHKPSDMRRGVIKEAKRLGEMDYSLGTHPLFEIVKCLRRIKLKPYGVFAAVRLFSFCKLLVERCPRVVNRDVVLFLRREQLLRLKQFAMGIRIPDL